MISIFAADLHGARVHLSSNANSSYLNKNGQVVQRSQIAPEISEPYLNVDLLELRFFEHTRDGGSFLEA